MELDWQLCDMSVQPHVLSILLLNRRDCMERWTRMSMGCGFSYQRKKILKGQVLQPQALLLIHLLWAACTALWLLVASESLVQERYMARVLIPAARPFSQSLSSTCFVWVSKEDPSEVHFSLLLLLDLDLLLQTGLLQNGLGWGKGWILVLGVSDTDALMSSMEVTGLNSPMVQICIALFCLWQERKE